MQTLLERPSYLHMSLYLHLQYLGLFIENIGFDEYLSIHITWCRLSCSVLLTYLNVNGFTLQNGPGKFGFNLET